MNARACCGWRNRIVRVTALAVAAAAFPAVVAAGAPPTAATSATPALPGATAAAPVPCGSVAQVGTTVTVTCAYVAGPQTWTVPPGVESEVVAVAGAQGGSDSYGDQYGHKRGIGGLGGQATATLAAPPGSVLKILVGGKGHDSADGAGGWNGGGHGGYNAAGGGGGSSVAAPDGALLVAAGGGGGSAEVECANTARIDGGAGGGTNGADGDSCPGAAGGGKGGTQTAGGAGGLSRTVDGAPGTFGAGGQGADLAGGGGGGWYGGGGGGSFLVRPPDSGVGTGGGGGSGYLNTGHEYFVRGEFLTAGRAGSGVVTVTYELPHPTTLTYDGATSGDYGAPAVLSATLSDDATGAGVSGREVSLGFGAERCTATTDGAGIARCSVTPVDAPATNPYPITATFAGAGGLLASQDTSRSFTVQRAATRLAAAPLIGLRVAATLTHGSTGAGIAGQPLTFAARGRTLCTATTDASGTAACASPSALFTALVSALFGGHYQAAYAGSAGYLPSQASAGLS